MPFRSAPKRWTRPEDYGHQPDGPRGPSGRPPRKRSGSPSRFLGSFRPWILLLILLGLWKASDPMLIEPPAALSTLPQPLKGTFTKCGLGRGTLCVIDGDTFKIGEKSVRIVGIDAPEIRSPRCAAELQMGQAATDELLRLLNLGGISVAGRFDEPSDQFGRQLRSVTRILPDGTTRSIADEMVASGKARRYLGGLRKGWC